MGMRKIWRLTLVAGLVSGGLSLSEPGEAAPEPDTRRNPAVDRRAGDPVGTQYIYKGSFTADVTHALKVEWGGPDSDTRNLSVSVAGTIPVVRARVLEGGYGVLVSTAGGSAQVTSASVSSESRTNDGLAVDTCTGSTATVTGPPTMRPAVDLLADAEFLPFALLTAPVNCTNNQGFPPTKGTYQYGPLWLPVIAEAGLGNSVIRNTFDGSYSTPYKNASSCAGYIPDQTPTCTYRIKGTLQLDLVKTIPPKPTKPKPTKPKPKATLSPDGTKVETGVRCPKRCTVVINLTGLKGGPTLTVPRVVRPKPGRTVKVKVAIPSKERAAVERAGGIRMRLTYRLAGGKTYSETRTARL